MANHSCLIVEDSPAMRQFLSHTLARIKDFDVVEAEDGLEGLKKLSARKFDIIIVDINMPLMNGLKLIKLIKSDETNSDIPIIIVSTEGAEEDQQRALQLGVNAYLTKPLNAQQVVSKVKESLNIEE
ncbi:MAG: response regulator [Proteobacteria bacterium]|nr:response regulator [Pseudomonadota bacterium]